MYYFKKKLFCAQGPVHRSWYFYFMYSIWQDAGIRTRVAATAARCVTNELHTSLMSYTHLLLLCGFPCCQCQTVIVHCWAGWWRELRGGGGQRPPGEPPRGASSWPPSWGTTWQSADPTCQPAALLTLDTGRAFVIRVHLRDLSFRGW